MTSFVEAEIASQPDCWLQAAEAGGAARAVLPEPGARVAIVGCGTSWHIAAAWAAEREGAGGGVTDAWPASESWPVALRGYDHVLALSRSGTTSEVLDALTALPAGTRSTAVTGDAASPVAAACVGVLELAFADEQSVVQTRFATSALVALRAALPGAEPVDVAVSAAREVLASPVPPELVDREHYVFLGRGGAVGLAAEAALKVREAAGKWTESGPALEYRHGPLSAAHPGSVIWALGEVPADLLADLAVSGAAVRTSGRDALAELVEVQRVAVATALARGLDPDNPRHLTRSVVLSGTQPGR